MRKRTGVAFHQGNSKVQRRQPQIAYYKDKQIPIPDRPKCTLNTDSSDNLDPKPYHQVPPGAEQCREQVYLRFLLPNCFLYSPNSFLFATWLGPMLAVNLVQSFTWHHEAGP